MRAWRLTNAPFFLSYSSCYWRQDTFEPAARAGLMTTWYTCVASPQKECEIWGKKSLLTLWSILFSISSYVGSGNSYFKFIPVSQPTNLSYKSIVGTLLWNVSEILKWPVFLLRLERFNNVLLMLFLHCQRLFLIF